MAVETLRAFTPGKIAAELKRGHDPVTAADHAVDAVLADLLPRPGEGWLSEETTDSSERLSRSRVWIVDPLDGTREFVDGVPEWCVSIGLVEDGRPVAGGICNPTMGHSVVGSLDTGVTLNGEPAAMRNPAGLCGIEVLASRSEVRRGEWDHLVDGPVQIRPMGSVAYKLALVAAGLADATWTLQPKNEWDVAAGAALVAAAGGEVFLPDGSERRFNQPTTKLPGFVACPAGLFPEIKELLTAP